MTGATGNIYTGLHEFEDMAFLLHALREDDVFVDVGSNVGSYTVLAGAVVGAKCIAFEPIPSTYHHLAQNVMINGIHSNVDTQNIGIGREKGELKFTSGMDAGNHVLSDGEQNVSSIAVPVKSLDDAVGAHNPTIIKIDVEGFETHVIDGAHAVLSAPSLLAVIMELNGCGARYGFDESTIHNKMLGYGFQTFQYSPFDRKLIPLNGKNLELGNTIYIKDKEQAENRVKSARPFTVNGQSV
jgi:FkbM family methyltransferase